MELSRNRGKQNHRKQLIELIARSEVSVLCSGWLKQDGLVELLPTIDGGLAKGARITVYSNEEHTEEAAKKALAVRDGLKHFVISKKTKYLHSKLYYFEHGGEFTALIGSANITYGGLVRNEELSVCIRGSAGDGQQHKILGYLDELLEVARSGCLGGA